MAYPFPRLLESDRGSAMPFVFLLGAIMVVLMSVIAVRSLGETDLLQSDTDWENALHYAESAVDLAVLELSLDDGFATVDNSTTLDSKDDIIAAAEVLAEEKKNVIDVGTGEAVIVRPPDGNMIYGVGFSPSADDPHRKVRVIAAEFDSARWTPPVAVLVGGNIKLEAKKNKKDVEISGGFHVAGTVYLKDKWEENVHGCLTAGGISQTDPKKGDPPYMEPYINDDCTAETIVNDVPIPEIDPLVLHKYSMYDMCIGKKYAYYGPAWQQTDPSAPMYLAPPAIAGTEGDPCSGSLVTMDKEVLGIADGFDKERERIKFKDKKNDEEGPTEAVYYLEGKSAELKVEKDQTLHLTLITSKPENDLTCKGKDDWEAEGYPWKVEDKNFGDIKVEVQEYAKWYPHPSARDYALVGAGDMEVKVKGDSNKQSQGTIYGILAVHEHIKIESNDITVEEGEVPKGGIQGTVIAEQACDTKDSKVKEHKSVFKKGDIFFDPGLGTTDFALKESKEKSITMRAEM